MARGVMIACVVVLAGCEGPGSTAATGPEIETTTTTTTTTDQTTLPGPAPQAYAVYVDETDIVWVSDFGGNALHRFDPENEAFDTFALPSTPSGVRQILGRPGEVWGAESAADALVVIRAAAD